MIFELKKKLCVVVHIGPIPNFYIFSTYIFSKCMCFLVSRQEIFDNDICRVCTNRAEIPITEKIGDTLIISAIRMVANISVCIFDFNSL